MNAGTWDAVTRSFSNWLARRSGKDDLDLSIPVAAATSSKDQKRRCDARDLSVFAVRASIQNDKRKCGCWKQSRCGILTTARRLAPGRAANPHPPGTAKKAGKPYTVLHLRPLPTANLALIPQLVQLLGNFLKRDRTRSASE